MQQLVIAMHKGSLFDVSGFNFSDTIEVVLVDLDTGCKRTVYVDLDTYSTNVERHIQAMKDCMINRIRATEQQK